MMRQSVGSRTIIGTDPSSAFTENRALPIFTQRADGASVFSAYPDFTCSTGFQPVHAPARCRCHTSWDRFRSGSGFFAMATRSVSEPARAPKPAAEALLRLMEARASAANLVRRGIVALNARRFDDAANCFLQAIDIDPGDRALPSLLASAHVGAGEPQQAIRALRIAAETDGTDCTSRIRHALTLYETGHRTEAIQSLRDGLQADPESAELHFQLGTLLAAIEDYDEAELRFTQAVNIQPDHSEAAIGLALCHGARGNPAEAFRHLHALQARYPRDARIGLLLTQAAKAVHQQGLVPKVRAGLAGADSPADEKGVEELSRVIEGDPDFVDAFLSIPVGTVDPNVYTMLLRTMEKALQRQPEHAELHFHCGQLLERLGRRHEAIAESERAVVINPSYTRALIELAKLYQQTDRRVDALSRLEQAIDAGAKYADVYCLLGDLHRDGGEWNLAREAYRCALAINARFERAREALEALPV